MAFSKAKTMENIYVEEPIFSSISAGMNSLNGREIRQYNEDQYRSIAEFVALDTGELSLVEGEIVTVIKKNSSGWWLVLNQSGHTGFTPATYLKPADEQTNTGEDWYTMITGPDSVYLAIKDYQAQSPDEISLRCGDEIEVLSTSDAGWWQVRHNEQIGLCPASCLTLKNSSAFQDPMNECRKSNLEYSMKGAEREAPPKTSSTKSSDSQSSGDVAKKGISVVALVDYNPGHSPHTVLLAFKKGDIGRLIIKAETGWWFIELKGFEGWVPVVYWEEAKEGRSGKTSGDISLHSSQWFFGKMSRDQCEDMFGKRGKNLDFMIRESVNRVGSYALSVIFNDKVHHFPIEKSPSGKFLIGDQTFDELAEIASYYTIYPLFYTDNRKPVSVCKPLGRT